MKECCEKWSSHRVYNIPEKRHFHAWYCPECASPLEEEKLCKHCNQPIELRNPSGFCDHLYYPENCNHCTELLKPTPL